MTLGVVLWKDEKRSDAQIVMYKLLIDPEDSVRANTILRNYPNCKFSDDAVQLHLFSDLMAGQWLLSQSPRRHCGRVFGYTPAGAIVVNGNFEFAVWPELGKRFDHPLIGSVLDDDRLKRRFCEDLYDSLPKMRP